jgi:hypothetical protein
MQNCGYAVAEQTFSKSCGLEVAECWKKVYDYEYANSFKICGYAVAEVLSSSCGVAVYDIKKYAQASLR